MGGVAFALFYATCGLPLAWLADRWSRANVIAIGLSVWSACTAACGAVQTAAQLFLRLMGVSFGAAGVPPPSFPLVSDYSPPTPSDPALALPHFSAPLELHSGSLHVVLISAL